MCGIVGIFGSQAHESLVIAMRETLAHRGPDGSGSWCEEGLAALGHRRLAILDPTDAGRQPMRRPLDAADPSRGELVITYNGELYNFPQLASRYRHEMQTRCDTEALLLLYRDHGTRCVEHLEGMFAFAIWNTRERTLFAARDPAGIKPLLYRPLPNGGLAIASELGALTVGDDARRELGPPPIDRTSLRDVLTYKYVPTPKTIYTGIFKLPPAHTLCWSPDEGVRIDRYWDPRRARAQLAVPRTLDEAYETFVPLFEQVVGEHTLSDVPLGVFLSGGIDSTAVTASLSDPRGSSRPHTFNLGFDVGSHDESAIAREVAQHLGTFHHHQRAEGQDLETMLDQFTRVFDEPFGDHGAYAMHLVARLARQHVTVALSGEGGDELFAGYHWYRKHPTQRARPHHLLAATLLPPLTAASRSAQRRLASGLERYAMFLGPFTPRQKASILHPQLCRGLEDYDDLWHFRQHWREDLSPLRRLQWADVHTYLVDDMLYKVDRATMATSLEARPPLVDRRLLEFALSLPDEVLGDSQHGKLLLRRYLNSRVPRHAFERRKIGFSMPVARWVRNQPELLRAATRRLHAREILADANVRPHNNEQTWTLLVLDRWLEQRA